jgi:ribonucleoside-diphosphate reductase beta chain
MNIFEERGAILPYEYPHLLKYKDAIRHSYWLHSEFNMTEDISEYKTVLTESERTVIKKTMLAIAQVEVSVKAFWGDLYKRMPKYEVQSIGATFSESEARHFDAYQFLLEKLGMQSEFSKVKEIPELHNRVKYLKKYLDGTRSRDNRVFTKSLVLFSLFIEHVSLFSQFLIIMSFNKERNTLNGMCNVVEATSKEEDVHGNFGIELVNIIKKENPEWFDEEFNNMIYSACKKSFKAESQVIDWIFSEGELDFLPPAVVKEYIKKRFNNSLVSIGLEPIFDISHELIEKTLWMDVELKSKKEGDFFFKKQIDYSKKTKSVDANELF